MPVAGERLEFCSNQDRFCDYCLWDYQPLTSVDQKFRSVNLLYHSFAYAGLDDRVYALCDAIREGIGAFQTVWGIKQAGGRLSWEFYFYDYGRLERKVSITRLLQIIKPFIPCTLIYSENRPYFMFSIEIDHRHINHRQRLDEIDIYIGNVGSSVSSGICYALTGTGLRLDNFYFFFDAKTERENIVGRSPVPRIWICRGSACVRCLFRNWWIVKPLWLPTRSITKGFIFPGSMSGNCCFYEFSRIPGGPDLIRGCASVIARPFAV